MAYPPIQVVDDNDQPLGGASMNEVHRQGLLHQIVVVLVEDPQGRLLLQKRGHEVSINQNMWDASAAGHVDVGESYVEAAKRELKEEIGVEEAELTEIAYFRTDSNYEWRKINRFRKVYRTSLPSDTKFKIEPEEVLEVRWFTLDEIRQLYTNTPNEIVKDFYSLIERLYK